MITNAIATTVFDGIVETARVNAKVYGKPLVLDLKAVGDEYQARPYDPGAYPPSGAPLASVLNDDTSQWLYVWPSGLVAGPDRVNWVWDFRRARRGPSYYLGFARQAEQQARRLRVLPEEVWGVPGYLIRGTCVFEEGPRFDTDPRDWRMVQAVSFPA